MRIMMSELDHDPQLDQVITNDEARFSEIVVKG